MEQLQAKIENVDFEIRFLPNDSHNHKPLYFKKNVHIYIQITHRDTQELQELSTTVHQIPCFSLTFVTRLRTPEHVLCNAKNTFSD